MTNEEIKAEICETVDRVLPEDRSIGKYGIFLPYDAWLSILTALSAGEGPTAEQLAGLARDNAEMAVQLVTARRSCPHCDAVVLPDDMGDHWRRCEKHPARIALSAIDSPNVITWSVMKQIARAALADPAPPATEERSALIERRARTFASFDFTPCDEDVLYHQRKLIEALDLPTPPAREDVPPAMRRLVAIVSDLDARGEVEPIVVDGVRAVVREHLTTPASAPEGDKP